MEDSVLPELRVLARHGEYVVQFPQNLRGSVGSFLREGDVVIIDRMVLKAHRARLSALLDARLVIQIDASEEQKSYEALAPIIEALIQGGLRRGNRLLAIGGGITQDVTAFIASILYRGVEWLFIPTTLLAQGDSCIGSKTSINFGTHKNQLGGFYPPRAIFIDVAFLETLPRREVLSGLGEMAHYFPIAGARAFSGFAARLPLVLEGEGDVLELVRDSLAIKQPLVESDEFDRGERQLFNYGHTFGHALESVTRYAVPHGIAVSYGIDLANKVSVGLGYLDPAIRSSIRQTLERIWSEAPLPEVDVAGYKEALLRDKKNRGSELGLILTRGWGDMFKEHVPLDSRLETWIEEFFAEVPHA